MKPDSPGIEAAEARYWHDAVALPGFRALIAAKKTLLVPMVLLYFGLFMGTTLLAGYAKPSDDDPGLRFVQRRLPAGGRHLRGCAG